MDTCAVVRTQHLLDVLRDARELGDAAFEQSVLEQLDVNVAYVRFETRQRPMKPYRWDEDDPALLEPIDEFRQRIGAEYRSWFTRDWTQWRERIKSSLTSLSAIYQRYYSADRIADIANRRGLAFLPTKFEKVEQLNRELDGDAIEMRFRVPMVATQPMYYGVFDVDGDDE
jgi:hypothetical protein